MGAPMAPSPRKATESGMAKGTYLCGMRTIVLVDGMRAVHCVRAVQTAMAMVPGVQWCDVTMGRVEVDHDGGATDAALRAAIAVAGFSVHSVRAERRLPIVGDS